VEFPESKAHAKVLLHTLISSLYDGGVFLLVEIKQGTNIEDRHIEQMEECNRVGIERAETYLTDSDVQEKTSMTGT